MTKIPNNGLLLDTHVWVWLNEGSPELKPNIVKLIDETAQKHGIFISAISVWEIATLANKKRLTLKMPIEEWTEQALSQPGVDLALLLPAISIESANLPGGGMHGDPADRLIIATARFHRFTLLTRDNLILNYAKKGLLSAIKI